MAKVGIGVLILVAVVYGVALAVPVEPQEQRPGLKLGGELAAEQSPNWSSMYGPGPKKIWVQTSPWYGIPHSVTTISFVNDGTLYVPARDAETKRWPKNVAINPNVTLKIDGQLYERKAVPITDPDELTQLRAAISAGMQNPLGDNISLFRMDAR